MVAGKNNPLLLPDELAGVATASTLIVTAPFGGLTKPAAKLALKDEGPLQPLNAWRPGLPWFISNNQIAPALTFLSEYTEGWTQAERDLTGLYSVLFDPFTPKPEADEGRSLYWRRADCVLEVLGCSFAAWEVLTAQQSIAEGIAEQSHGWTRRLLTSESLVSFAEGIHQAQAWFTGVYIPYADSALRWGQHQLDGMTDREVAALLARDVLIVDGLHDIGADEQVLTYVDHLADDIRDMSKRQATGNNVDQRTKQIAMFREVLKALSPSDPNTIATPDAAPNFERMRLTEARALANVQGLLLVDQDGQYDGMADSTERGVWQADNWRVVNQRPRPGKPMTDDEVWVWVLKKGEALSSYQAGRYRNWSKIPKEMREV